jgi:hypothetical protein
MYFLNSQRTLCHILEDKVEGKAPAPCGSKVQKIDILRYQNGKPCGLLREKPSDIPLCKHCEKGMVWMRAV